MKIKELQNWRENLQKEIKSLRAYDVWLTDVAKRSGVSRQTITGWFAGNDAKLVNFVAVLKAVEYFKNKTKKLDND